MGFKTPWHAHAASEGIAQRYFEDDGKLVRHKRADIEPVIERNRRIANETDGRTKEGGRFIGSVPAIVLHDWIAEWTRQGKIGPGNMGGLNDLIKQRLRDSDYSKFRTTWGGI